MENSLHLLPIAITGIFAAAIIFERVSFLFFKCVIDAKLFLGQIEALLSKGNVQGAIDLCASNEKSILARVIKAGLLKANRSEEEIKTTMEVAMLDGQGLIMNRIGYLAMIANVATLLGLLGTIGGLIQSFKAVASADAATKQSLLAEGISTSMNATALGLVVAIPTMIAFSVLNGRANKLLDETEKGAGRLLNSLHARIYVDEGEDFSKASFDEVQGEQQAAAAPIKLKGAA